MTPDLTPEQLDLLIALTDGSLSDDALAHALDEVRADPVLRAEHDRQLEALAFLGTARAAPMAEFEAARMRRAVLDSVAPVPTRVTPRWAGRLLPVAAALAVVVLGVGFLSNAGRDSAGTFDESADATATQAVAATEAAAAEMAPAATESSMALEAEDAAGAMAAEAPLPDEDFAARMAMLPSLGALGPDDLPAFADTVDDYVLEKGYVATPLFDVIASCDGVDVDGEMLLTYTVAATASWDGLDVVVLEMTESGGPIVVLDPTTCEAIHVYVP